ncbi:outer membrane lipoprotein LolB [Castellaniella sp. GW247-6E4]|uniref:outer membrane lipoprotein LolB n=1 Tax=Castellaniella sp. GW247-6E4 TaxID=3140380 RepID=UPI003315B945
MKWVRILALALVAVLLASCATPERIGGAGPAFERTGRFAVSARPAEGPAQAAQGNFAWRDTGAALRLDLLSPMGGVLARIFVEPGQAVLERANGERERAANADALLAELWGEAVPVAGLRAWIQGRPWAGGAVDAVRRDDQGRIIQLVQDGWTVRLWDYDGLGPGRLRLARDQAGRRISVQLIVD